MKMCAGEHIIRHIKKALGFILDYCKIWRFKDSLEEKVNCSRLGVGLTLFLGYKGHAKYHQ